MVQGFALAHTATTDKVTPAGSALIYGIAGVHLLIAVVTFRSGFPHRRPPKPMW
jgi:3-methyladenine DNA glycosylase Mpg